VVSSDLARAWTTARIVAEGPGIPLIREPGLRESRRDRELVLAGGVKSRFGETLTERWLTDNNAAFPGGQTGLETRMRGLTALRRFVEAQALSAVWRVDPHRDGAAANEARYASRQSPGDDAQISVIPSAQ